MTTGHTAHSRAARRAGWRGLALAIALACGGAALAACGSPTAAPPPASVTTTSASPTTTGATATTLPVPVVVSGTRPGGPFASFGPIERVEVAPVPIGADAPTSAPASTLVPPAGSAVIAYREFGGGPGLVLVPGERASMDSWDPQLLSDLAQHYTVVEFDLPGTGYSGPAPGAIGVEPVADLIAGLVAALGLAHPVVLGWGLGGTLSLALAERHPGIVARLALVDTSAGGPSAVPPAARVAAELASPDTTPLEQAALLFPSAASAASTGWLARVAQLPPDTLIAEAIGEEAALQDAGWLDGSIASGLPRIAAHALVVTGSLDVVEPEANAVALMAGLRHARELLLPGAGYASISQDEPQFVSALEAFTG